MMTVNLMTVLAQTAPQGGGYMSTAKIVFMLLLVLPWLAALPWVRRDVTGVRGQQGLWIALTLGLGLFGLLLWFMIPVYAVGLGVYAVLTLAGLVAYVVYRNGRVDPPYRILTPSHLAGLFSRSRRPKTEEVVQRLKIYSADRAVGITLKPGNTPQEVHAYNLVQEFVYDLVWRRASEADLSPLGTEARVRIVVDGVPEDRPRMPLTDSEAIINFLKAPAGMNPEERRRPQQGMISVDLAQGHTDIILTTTGTTGGQRMQFRVVSEAVQTRLDELGLPDAMEPKVKAMAQQPQGLLIVAAPRASGQTSTLYSLLRMHDAFTRQLVTLEAKPAADLENITQNVYKDDAELPGMLASVLRRDPDVVMVDQCPDPKTAALIIEAAARKPVFLGVRGNDSFVVLARWIKAAGDASSSVANLHGVLCQALVRKLCPACREAYRPDPQLLAKINISAGKVDKFYRTPTRPPTDDKGNQIVCQTCQGSGYFGRTAVFELLELTDEVRSLIASAAPLAQLKAACRKNRMLYLQEQAILKVIDGTTSMQEVLRLSQQK